ncbi:MULTISPECIES: hypothetical protein [unclassified Pseudoclavibacter]|uniref:hypothetical protein n=1 Tax=unclassified Pseudoclavibacter TaxID=2615177 RepID=UPI001300F7F7|nr:MULTISPECIES: hypothetical protein [unclassified Pseudoclavibacter]KAB1645628.1 hypothetical protein F8O06_08660 [Pseudoclavibacter sp. CFCC 14310]KAB1664466.1 hypothetical protein F8O08_03510 [Pseudoclavibacter sp. CFCC 13611]
MDLTRITVAWTAITVAVAGMLLAMRSGAMISSVVLIVAMGFMSLVLLCLACALLVRGIRPADRHDQAEHAKLAAQMAALSEQQQSAARLIRAIARVEASHDLLQSAGKARARVDLGREIERQRRMDGSDAAH